MSSSKARGEGAAAFFGLLAVLTIPVDIGAARLLNGVELIRSLYVAVPVAAVFALTALAASRKARYARARSVYAGNGRRGAVLAWAGLYCAFAGAIALAVYGGVRAAE